MLRCRLYVCLALSFILCPSSTAARAAEVLNHVPNNALGFVIVKNVGATNTKAERLLDTLQAEFPGPLAFLQAATGISNGLDPDGDFLLTVLPGAAANSDPQFAVFLPVQDYGQLISALGGAPNQHIAGVTVAGEDLLVAQLGPWAVIMDPDQRPRLEQMLAGTPNPPPNVAAWNDWIDANDVAVVALPAGIRRTLIWAATAQPNPPHNSDGNPVEFGLAEDQDDAFGAPDAVSRSMVVDASLRAMFRKWTVASPQLAAALLQARLVGSAVRLDGGNLHVALRVMGPDERWWSVNAGDGQHDLSHALYQGGNFVIHGAGHLPPPLTSIAAGAYFRALIDELKTEEGMVLRDTAVRQLQAVVERTSAEVQSVAVLSQPGDKQGGVYTNDFLVVRANSARRFAESAKDAMRLWNTMNRDARAQTQLIFDVNNEKFGDREATQYSLDIAAADGAPELPEIRQAMEQLFGPGGKLRLWIVPVDDHDVLLASGTPEQIRAALQSLDQKRPIDWSRAELTPSNQLLPADAGWRLFFNPHRHNVWRRRQMDAITGPVIGGPLVKDFPSSPAIGFAGRLRDGELSIEAAVPAETIKSAGIYFKN